MFEDIIDGDKRRKIVHCKKCKQYYFNPPNKECPVCSGAPRRRINLFDETKRLKKEDV
jgi:rRNA maturation endonuclease Nob1